MVMVVVVVVVVVVVNSLILSLICCMWCLIGRGQSSIAAVQWFPRDNGMFVSGSTDGVVRVWDSNTAQVCVVRIVLVFVLCH
jgi:WD40 repeat protein